MIHFPAFPSKSTLKCDQGPDFEAWSDQQTIQISDVAPSVSVKTSVSPWKLFTSHLTPSSVAVQTLLFTLFTVPSLLPEEMGGKSKEGMGDVNLGQLSVQFLPLRELFVSAAESFIIMGCWCTKGKASYHLT